MQTDRILDIDGVSNARDFGGYYTEDGRQVRWRKLFRTGHLSGLTEIGVRRLKELNVNLVFDFRQRDEVAKYPSCLDAIELTVAQLPIEPGSILGFFRNLHHGEVNAERTARLMMDIYREFVLERNNRFAEMFRLIIREKPRLLIHCAAGKDRTGFAAAMILRALGVPAETVLEDYCLSNGLLPIEQEFERIVTPFNNQRRASEIKLEGLLPLLQVRREYLLAAFDQIEHSYGDMAGFLNRGLGLSTADLSELREYYLY